MRAIAGGAATGIPLSQWFLLVMAFASLFMVAGKRYAELQLAERTGAKIHKSLESYTSTYLRFVWTVSATAVVVCCGLWAFERDGNSASWFAVSMIPITIAILRYARSSTVFAARYHVVPQHISPQSAVARVSSQQVVFQEISEDSREILRGCVGVIAESVSELKSLINDGPPWQFSTDLVAEFRLYLFPDRLVDAVSTVETG